MRPDLAICWIKPGRGLPLPVFAVLLLVMLGFDAHAYTLPSCPAGQTHLWTATTGFVGNLCISGQTFDSVSTAQSACTPGHGVIVNPNYPNSDHFTGAIVEPYEVQLGVVQLKTQYHFAPDNHNISNSSATLGQLTHSCVDEPPEQCPPAGTPHVGVVGGLCVGEGCATERGICLYNDDTGTQCAAQPTHSIADDGSTVVTGTYNYTGAACDSEPFNEAVPPHPEGCVTSESGKSVCLTAQGCGTVNGEQFCVADIPEATNCATNASGGRICLDAASSTERPDNGTAGQPATPDAVVRDEAVGGTVAQYYSQTTVNSSTNMGTGGGGGGGGECGGQGQPACPVGQACGGEGQPICKVDIDETGVAEAGQTFEASMQAKHDAANAEGSAAFESATAGLGDGGAKNPGTGWTPGDLIPDLGSSTCQTITVEFMFGQTKTFPTPALCDFLEDKVKPTLAFFLYVITAGMIVFGAVRNMSPGAS